MSVNEELHEHTEHAHDDFSRRAAASMAIVAAMLAVVAVVGHITNTEELLAQQKASDQWAFYQAKSIRRYQSEAVRDILLTAPGEAAAKSAAKYLANQERYEKEGAEIMEKAKEFEAESTLAGKRVLRLHVGEVFLEIAIVFSSLAILTRKSRFWYSGIVSAIFGAVVAASSLLVAH